MTQPVSGVRHAEGTSNPPEQGSFGIESPKLPCFFVFTSCVYRLRMETRIVATDQQPVALSPVPAEQLPHDRAPRPSAGVIDLSDCGVPCGLWEHTVGTSTDVEVDEVFVGLAGHARIEVADGPVLEVGPGDVVSLAAGARTTWHVTQTLKKFWVTPTG